MRKVELEKLVNEMQVELQGNGKRFREQEREMHQLRDALKRSTNIPERQTAALESIALSLESLNDMAEKMGIPIAICTINGLGKMFPIHVQSVTAEEVQRSVKQSEEDDAA
jgi:hypothetical protein